MQKQFLILFFAFFAASLAAQQSNLTGIVIYHNSKFETGKTIPVQNATVEEAYEGKFSTLTKADGAFKMVLVGIETGKNISLNASKNDEDLEVVNSDRLQAVAGQKSPVKIYMASRKKLADAKREYYRIGKTEAEKVLNSRYKKAQDELFALKEKAEGNELRIAELQKELTVLMADSRKIEDYAKDLAERYARVNLDDASALYLEAFRQFQAGKLKEALLILQRADLAGQAEKIWDEEKKIGNLRNEASLREKSKDSVKQELMHALRLKADLHKAERQWDSVEATYELLVRLDTNALDNLKSFADYLSGQNKKRKAITYYKRCLEICDNETCEVAIYQLIGNDLRSINRMTEAELMYTEALNILSRMGKADSVNSSPYLASLLLDWGVYQDIQNNPDAEKYLIESMEIYQRLNVDNDEENIRKIGLCQLNLGNYYFTNQNIEKAEQMYLKALSTYDILMNIDSLRFEYESSQVLNNLGELYRVSRRPQEADEMYKRVFSIAEKLAINNPARYEPLLSKIAINMGMLYLSIGKKEMSEKMHLLSLQIRQKLASSNPEQFEPDLAMTYMTLGNFYARNNNIEEAEKMFIKSLEIRERLAENDPAQFDPDVAITTVNLGTLYRMSKEWSKAEDMYLRSLDVRKRLSEDNYAQFAPGLARTATNLGVLYGEMAKVKEAEQMFLYAIEIQENIDKTYQNKQIKDELATTITSFGLLYEKYQQFDKSQAQYKRALALRQKAIMDGQKYQMEEFNEVHHNLVSLRDTFSHQKNYAAAASIQQACAASLDSLRLIDSTYLRQAPLEYDTLAHYFLLARNFPAAEAAALRGLALDPAQAQINSNLAATLLLRGKVKEAKTVYQSFAGRQQSNTKTSAGSSVSQLNRDRCLRDIEDLQAANVATARDVRRVNGWVK